MTSQALVEAGFRNHGTSHQEAVTTASAPLSQKVEGIPGEHLIGLVFAIGALIGGGWFFWTLARALDAYRVY